MVPFLMPSAVNAAVLASPMWVPLATMIGLFGAATSSSALFGRRFSWNLFSLADTHAANIHSPFGVFCAQAAICSSACLTEAVSG